MIGLLILLQTAFAASIHSVFEKIDGPTSSYTPLLIAQLKKWPPRNFYDASDSKPLHLRCYETPGNETYIGAAQWMHIHAPISAIEQVLDGFENYQKLFPGFDDVHVVSRDSNRLVTYWESHVPIPFVSNVKYELTYLIDKTSAKHRVYRYQLKKPGDLIADDGFIVLDQEEGGWLYTEIDFYDANWGVAKSLSPGAIWKSSLEGIFLSDVAIKLKSENPSWSYSKITSESGKILKEFDLDAAITKRAGQRFKVQ